MIRELPRVLKFRDGAPAAFSDVVAVEEPLEIRLEWPTATRTDSASPESPTRQKSVAITMRTPGQDIALALGFLFTEGMVTSSLDIVDAKHCGPVRDENDSRNILKVKLKGDVATIAKLEKMNRNFFTTSSCGICGKSSIDALKTENQILTQLKNVDGPRVSSAILAKLPDLLRGAQMTFDQTGGLHGAAFFTPAGLLIGSFEDVGRHNALDKLIGQAFMADLLPAHDSILMLSGRISFELVQKAAMAGVRIIAAIGAPSSLAIELAEELQITLIGFLRNSTFNVYTVPWRVL